MWWGYFACFVVALFGVFGLDAAKKRAHRGAAKAIAGAMIVAAVVLFGKGLVTALDWADPFAGRHLDVARTSSGPRSLLVVAALSVWPYFLMAVAVGGALVGSTAFRRRSRGK